MKLSEAIRKGVERVPGHTGNVNEPILRVNQEGLIHEVSALGAAAIGGGFMDAEDNWNGDHGFLPAYHIHEALLNTLQKWKCLNHGSYMLYSREFKQDTIMTQMSRMHLTHTNLQIADLLEDIGL